MPAQRDDLTPEQERWLVEDERVRSEARALAASLALDPHDVYRVLKQLERSPAERLRRGLAHGRLGRPQRR
ncbi:MAG: hypothetical protein KIT84_42490 [Labilithrix sp.]|nr:hypothetical protein [Labilithrix sp.]MCW5817746.1 hypothetical protein [Labilithrix sp.]